MKAADSKMRAEKGGVSPYDLYARSKLLTNFRMRAALAPTSLRPMRDLERMSRRLPSLAGSMRITTSSLKPNQKVVAVALLLNSFRATRQA